LIFFIVQCLGGYFFPDSVKLRISTSNMFVLHFPISYF